MPIVPFLPILIVGTLRQDYLIAPGGKSLDNIPGGHLFYTALSAHHWENLIGLVSRIGPSYPTEWVDNLASIGMDTRGIKRTALPIEHRFFIHSDSDNQKSTLYPMAQYANEGLPFPKGLLGYNQEIQKIDSLTEKNNETIIAREIPADYLETPFIHFCPMDYLTHNLLTQHFVQFGQKRISLRSGEGYMVPQFWNAMPTLLGTLTVFITTDSSLRSLFAEQRGANLLDRMKHISDWGPEYVVVLRDDRSAVLWDRNNNTQYLSELYPTKIVNLTGVKDAFCGGIIECLRKTFDPVESLIAGNVAASFAIEATHPFYTLDVVPGLHEARADFLRDRLKTIQ